jgi:hypothetical protein
MWAWKGGKERFCNIDVIPALPEGMRGAAAKMYTPTGINLLKIKRFFDRII